MQKLRICDTELFIFILTGKRPPAKQEDFFMVTRTGIEPMLPP